jgi:hypothetical protein
MPDRSRVEWISRYRGTIGGGLFVTAVLASVLLGIALPRMFGSSVALAWAFLGQASLFSLAAAGAGVSIKNHPLGALIDKRNRISLSKLQMLLWTILVLSALVTVVEWRLAHGFGMDALEVVIPGELLAAMGIATTSLVAAPVVLSLKPEGTDSAVAVDEPDGPVRLVDIVQGDETGNRDSVDLSKLQQLAITLMLIGLYGGLIFGFYWNLDWAKVERPFKLPSLSQTFIQLMAISHAGYLLYKAAPKPDLGSGADLAGPKADIGTTSALG